MTVLVHLNHGINKTYLVRLNAGMTRDDLKKVLAAGQNRAAERLFLRSHEKIEVTPQDVPKAAMAADFVVSQYGYTSERLA